jgi:hypothetical protein
MKYNHQKDIDASGYHQYITSEIQQSKFELQVENISPRESLLRRTRYAELEKYFPHGSKG